MQSQILIAAGCWAPLKFVWTPSHMRVGGNGKVDELVEASREMHPNNKKRRNGCGRMRACHQCARMSPPPQTWATAQP